MPRPLDWYKRLSDSRARSTEGFFVVEGLRALSQVLRSSVSSIDEVVVAEGTALPLRVQCPVRTVSRRQFDSLAPSRTPQGMLGVVRVPAGVEAGTLPVKLGGHVLVLEHVQDPGNVGTLIRDAAAFGFGGVVLSDKCADPFSPKCVQASAGTVLSVWIRRSAGYLDMVRALKSSGCTVCAADSHAEPGAALPTGPTALVLGSEGSGLSGEMLVLADARVAIAINTTRAESLNVAAAGAVLMYLLAR